MIASIATRRARCAVAPRTWAMLVRIIRHTSHDGRATCTINGD